MTYQKSVNCQEMTDTKLQTFFKLIVIMSHVKTVDEVVNLAALILILYIVQGGGPHVQ